MKYKYTLIGRTKDFHTAHCTHYALAATIATMARWIARGHTVTVKREKV